MPMNERDQYYESNIKNYDTGPWVKKSYSNYELSTNIYNDFSNSNSNSNSSSPEDNPYKLINRRIDRNKVNSKERRSHRNRTVNFTGAEDAELSANTIIRSGAIIYTKLKGETLFCLGVDAQFGDLTDFGGGVKKSEDIITGGLRELEEESLGIFGKIDREDVLKVPTAWSNNISIMFIPMILDIDNTLDSFHYKLSDKKNIEVKDIVWLSKEEFLESIYGNGRRLYSRVRRLLRKVTAHINIL